VKILFIELLGGLGDVLIALPAIQALAASHPQAHLSVLTFEPGGELLDHHPLIQTVIQIPKGTASQAVKTLLQQQSYDLIVSDTSYEGIAELIRHSGSRTVTNLWRQPPAQQLVSDRFLHILLEEGLVTAAAAQDYRHPQIHLTATERTQMQAQLGSIPRPLIGLYPDAGMAIKRWSVERFLALGEALQQRCPATFIVPEGSDPDQVKTITRGLKSARSWPRGSLRQLAALLAQTDCLIAADTGPARIAAALGVPTITLFGPSWHGRYGQPPPHVNLQGCPDCPERKIGNFTEQSCWYSGECPFGWDTCVNLIAPERVVEAVAQVLDQFSIAEGRRAKAEEGRRKCFLGQDSSDPDSPSLRHAPLHPRFSGYSTQADASQPVASQLSPPADPSWPSATNLLVLRLDNIGDVLMTSPALRAIKANQPGVRLTLMASPAGALTAPLLPWVDAVLPWRVLWQDLGRLPFEPQREWQLIQTLQAGRFDAAIIFTSFKQSPHPAAFVCQLAGIPLRLGESKESSSALTHAAAAAPDDLHQVERNLRLIESVGYAVADRHLCLQIPGSSLVPNCPYLLLNPWTSCEARTYSSQRFAIAAKALSQITGWQVVITGTAKDREQAAPLLEALGDRGLDLVGKTSLSDLVALIASAQLLLSNNTSTMHIADATQTPSVILFSGTELECQWRPRRTPAILLRRPTPCSPCYDFTCPYQLECLDIEPEAVVNAGLQLLQGG